jgi:hypothetical protein
MFAKLEIGVTKFSPKKRPRHFFRPETAFFNGAFHFFGRGTTNFRSCKMGLKCDKKAAQVSKSVLFG